MRWRLGAELGVAAAWTGQRLDAGAAAGVPQQEETVTETVLLDLALRAGGHRVEVFTRAEESAVGADWVWWLQDDRSAQWVGLLVQAKRLHLGGAHRGTYALGQRKDAASPRQVDVLDRAARWTGLPALYALYNPLSWSDRASEPCPQDGPFTPEPLNGITFLHGLSARRLCGPLPPGAQHVPVAAVRPYAVPWSCLVTCELHDHRFGWWPRPHAGSVLASVVAGNVKALVSALGPDPGRAAALSLADAAVREAPPAYVLDRESRARAFDAGLAAADALSSPDEDFAFGAGADSIPAGAGGVVIVRRPEG